MRGLVLFGLGAIFALAGEWFWRHQGEAHPFFSKVQQPVQPVATVGSVKQCRDDCEQWSILLGGTDAGLRDCRRRCEAALPPAPPREVPRSISVAPPRTYDPRPHGTTE
jgi:hypothetical protein